MSQTQRTVSEIIPKRLSLVERRWTNKNDSETVSFRIRVYSEELKKYNFISLKSTNVKDAKLEGIRLYGTLVSAIETGKPIGNDRRKLSHYISMFMEHTETRCKNGHLTQHRVRCIKQLLVCLEKFAKYKNNQDINKLVDSYEEEFESWRDKSLTRLTNKPLTPRTRNNEYSAHRQFFGFLKNKNIISKIPPLIKQRVLQTNNPFPQKNYNKLMSVMRNEIIAGTNPKTKWNWNCMRTVILLM